MQFRHHFLRRIVGVHARCTWRWRVVPVRIRVMLAVGNTGHCQNKRLRGHNRLELRTKNLLEN